MTAGRILCIQMLNVLKMLDVESVGTLDKAISVYKKKARKQRRLKRNKQEEELSDYPD